ncbi:16S rRNA (guanine(966)-N(2))-methyltransferase RsmD [Candidatus Phycosocius spiralis]|uniref:Methyltransferase n=1 Tax=Candidatus Phycosocius spiralis TaxID=2815099 RepID=A0ABQ4PV22_9PROT|nr:16S rRNA (guanine(966)-N(2))-methyltransferase RsmD [Candidatus Phycosocius spiralis]GIU66870.1 methyltransferase [Candidatus Phycosocius spiralis]
MRIVSGRWKGKALVSPKGSGTRPTSDKARQAIFNIIEHAPWSNGLQEALVLDVFAGTGALGLEALSRGARTCLFIDHDPNARAVLASNIEACAAQGISRVWKRDATCLGVMPASANGPFDLVFVDPPYGKGYDGAVLRSLSEGWLKADSLIVLERGRAEPRLETCGFDIIDHRDYGAAHLVFLKPMRQAI